jgi:hypothetical protein
MEKNLECQNENKQMAGKSIVSGQHAFSPIVTGHKHIPLLLGGLGAAGNVTQTTDGAANGGGRRGPEGDKMVQSTRAR